MELPKFLTFEYGPVIWGSEEGMSDAAALVHAVDSVVGRSVACLYREELKTVRPSTGSLGGLSETLKQMWYLVSHELWARIEVRKMKVDECAAFERHSYTQMSAQRICYPVYLFQPRKTDRKICVDGPCRLVWNNKETHVLMLNEDSCVCFPV